MAVSQRYEELHPGVQVRWEKRTLDEFGHTSIDQLCHDFDLIIIDHPWTGFCFKEKIVVDLKPLLSQDQWGDLQQNLIGKSFQSYILDNQLLAVPIDTASPASSWRKDLMIQNNFELPVTWDDLIKLSDKKAVVMPGFDADLFLNWLMLLYALDGRPFDLPENIVDKEIGLHAAALLKRLAEAMPNEIVHWNPIILAELMTQQNRFAYCPFAYSYNNYSRPSFVKNILTYGDLVTFGNKPLRSILGGTGIAISSKCQDVKLALDFSIFCASTTIQLGIYTYAGGQPARQEAWKSRDLNIFTNNFFKASYNSHQNALVRPRYSGFVGLQKKAGILLQRFILGDITGERMWNLIKSEYHESRKGLA